MQDHPFVGIVLPGVLVLLAVVIFVGAFVRADLWAQDGLARARAELFGTERPLRYHSIFRSSWIYRYRVHPRFSEYHLIHRQEARKGLKRLMTPTLIAGALILLSVICKEAARAMG